ncbi:MAG: alpha/beta hydrolase [Spirochaetales bacterium]|nr:alpha/beta hydrolase [Spirochaetales bacterium]
MKCKKLMIAAGIIAGLLIIIVVTLMILSRALIYVPAPYNKTDVQAKVAADPAIDEIFLDADGARLHGYVITNTESENAPWAVYFGGQGDEAFRYADTFREIKNCNFVMFNYRGYGLSTGTPTEQTLFADAETIYQDMKKTYMDRESPLYIMGFSLGSGVAVSLASTHQPKMLFLSAPYDSVRSVARNYLPDFVLSIFLHEDFDSLSRIKNITCPVLVFATPEDHVIKLKHTQTLFNAMSEPKQLFLVPDVKHWEIVSSNIFSAVSREQIR